MVDLAIVRQRSDNSPSVCETRPLDMLMFVRPCTYGLLCPKSTMTLAGNLVCSMQYDTCVSPDFFTLTKNNKQN